jgi:ribose-phosphate pyrophosphokinase
MAKFKVSYDESIRGQSVFAIQSTMPPADNLMELLLMLDAAKRASAKEIIACYLILVMLVKIEKINLV